MRNSLLRVNRTEEVNKHWLKGYLNLIKLLSFLSRYFIEDRQNLMEQKILQHLEVILYA